MRNLSASSFAIHLILEVLNSAQGAFVAAGLLGSAFAFWWMSMRRRVKNFEHLAGRSTVKVTFQDDETIEISEAEWKLYNDKRAYQAIRKILRPPRERTVKMAVIEPPSCTTSTRRSETELPSRTKRAHALARHYADKQRIPAPKHRGAFVTRL